MQVLNNSVDISSHSHECFDLKGTNYISVSFAVVGTRFIFGKVLWNASAMYFSASSFVDFVVIQSFYNH